MKRLIPLSILFLVLFFSMELVAAVSQEELNEAKSLIDSKIICSKLSNEQLEIIGEYYMEQMMPGISHERAHEMMGIKEGSEAEEQFHINLAKRSYCGENIGMMGWGMMGNNYQAPQYNNLSYGPRGFEIFFYIILTLIVLVIILIIILIISRSRNNTKQKMRKTK